MQIIPQLFYQERVCLVIFLLSHTEKSLVGCQKAKLGGKKGTKGRDDLKGVCKAVMNSQKMCDNCSVCDFFFLRTENGGDAGVGKECKAVWRSKVKCIQAWGIEDIWSYPDQM